MADIKDTVNNSYSKSKQKDGIEKAREKGVTFVYLSIQNGSIFQFKTDQFIC